MRGGPPDKLTARHKRIAHLEATGWSPKRIAAKLAVKPSMVTRLRQLAEYRQLVERYAEEQREKEAFDLRKGIAGLGKEVFDTKRDLMRQRRNLHVANAAADSFLDRLYPKKHVSEHDAHLRVSVSLEDARHFRDVLHEDGAIDAEWDALPGPGDEPDAGDGAPGGA